MPRGGRRSPVRKAQPARPTPLPGATARAEASPGVGEADRALLALSRELAEARAEDQISAALARALEALFPGRAFSIRLVDPRSLALTTFHAQGRLRPGVRGRLTHPPEAVGEAGLSPPPHGAGGVLKAK